MTEEPVRRPPLDPNLERIGRYRIMSRLGKGAMGVVYAAHDDVMEREVAVKVLMADLEEEPEIRTRFMREAQVAARLSHPNIVTVFDVGEDRGRLFIVMELLQGMTLAELLKDRRLSLEESTDIMIQVAEGLSASAAAAVCHRDIKPGNLFLKADGGVKILDFGIARLASSNVTASGSIVGTPDYMSPEQVRGLEIDVRSDMFSLGAVWYLLVSGRKPFAAPELPAILHRVCAEDPLPLTDAETPAALARIIRRALAKAPGDRYGRIEEIIAEASRFRRQYGSETRALAARAFAGSREVLTLIDRCRALAADLGVAEPFTAEEFIGELAGLHPMLQARGCDALTLTPLPRTVVEQVSARVVKRTHRLHSRIIELREASDRLTRGLQALHDGDPSRALAELDDLSRQVASPLMRQHLEKRREKAFEPEGSEPPALANPRPPAGIDLQLATAALVPDVLEIGELPLRAAALGEGQRPLDAALAVQATAAWSGLEARLRATGLAIADARVDWDAGRCDMAIERLTALAHQQGGVPWIDDELARLVEVNDVRKAAAQRLSDGPGTATTLTAATDAAPRFGDLLQRARQGATGFASAWRSRAKPESAAVASPTPGRRPHDPS